MQDNSSPGRVSRPRHQRRRSLPQRLPSELAACRSGRGVPQSVSAQPSGAGEFDDLRQPSTASTRSGVLAVVSALLGAFIAAVNGHVPAKCIRTNVPQVVDSGLPGGAPETSACTSLRGPCSRRGPALRAPTRYVCQCWSPRVPFPSASREPGSRRQWPRERLLGSTGRRRLLLDLGEHHGGTQG